MVVRQKRFSVSPRQCDGYRSAGIMYLVRIYHFGEFAEIIFLRESQGKGLERTIHEFVFEGLAKSFDETFVQYGFTRVVQQVQDLFASQSLAGIPAVKGIIIVTHKNGQVCIAVVGFQHHWRREPPQDGRHRPVADFAEYKNLLGFRQIERVFMTCLIVITTDGFERFAVGIEKRCDDRHLQGDIRFGGLMRCLGDL